MKELRLGIQVANEEQMIFKPKFHWSYSLEEFVVVICNAKAVAVNLGARSKAYYLIRIHHLFVKIWYATCPTLTFLPAAF